MAAMQHVGVQRKQMELVVQALAAVLHIGNVNFQPEAVGDAEGCSVRNLESLQIACHLLGLDTLRVEHALCSKLLETMAPGGKIESYEMPQNRVNHALDIEKKAEKLGEMLEITDMVTIGILDIYGLEVWTGMDSVARSISETTNKLLRDLFPEAIDLNDKRMANPAGYKIRPQCDALVTALMDCTPHDVRCIKCE
ncbi:hypothetical protein PsorP6_015515 [Peronosclerospora sorghi]|uniref:Uncharacterized protein n=1 Tax=Peronosclerospora sorghi TaxID=230839 RepID=A0ACC0WQL3_9STRA|nr:hypothetical protein PsorP6_015515 [Peronosclerospora sorghi]